MNPEQPPPPSVSLPPSQSCSSSSSNWKPSWMKLPPAFSYDALHQEHASLSALEKHRIARQRHGVQPEDEVVETEELVSQSLQALDNAIDNIPEKEAYETALFIIPEHVECSKFRLAFLRADRFQIGRAAQRIVTYWQRKVELFGTERAFTPYVNILDFPEDDYEALVRGGVKLLPDRDGGGRAILFSFMRDYFGSSDTMLRLMWLMIHVALFDQDDDEIQKNGVVILSGNGRPQGSQLPFDSLRETERYWYYICHDSQGALPMKTAAVHCFPPNYWAMTLNEHLLYFLHPSVRCRLNLHDPSKTAENLHRLAHYGITPDVLPVELGGQMDFNYQDCLYDRLVEDLSQAGIDTDLNEYLEESAPGIDKLMAILSTRLS